jgi:hypothetical protein
LAGRSPRSPAAVAWCAEVNGRRHADTAAIPADRLATERALLRALPSLRLASAPIASRKFDALSTVRFGSARSSVPAGLRGERVDLAVSGSEFTISQRGTTVARHRLVGPGELALDDVRGGDFSWPPVGTSTWPLTR